MRSRSLASISFETPATNTYLGRASPELCLLSRLALLSPIDPSSIDSGLHALCMFIFEASMVLGRSSVRRLQHRRALLRQRRPGSADYRQQLGISI